MIGKKNVVFGFLFLVVTAALGPYMILTQVPGVGDAQAKKQENVGRLQSLKANEFEEELEPLTAEAIAKANTPRQAGPPQRLSKLAELCD